MPPAAAPDSPSRAPVLWLSPLDFELAPFLGLCGSPTPAAFGGVICRRATLCGREVLAVVCGMGGAACRATLAALLPALPGSPAMVVGTAGALDPRLRVGDVICSNTPAIWEEGPAGAVLLGARWDLRGLDDSACAQEAGNLRVKAGAIVSSDEPVIDPAERAAMRAATGADCVDMETGYIAQACAAAGAPFLAVRSIAERAGEEGPDGRRSHDLAIAAWQATIAAVELLATR